MGSRIVNIFDLLLLNNLSHRTTVFVLSAHGATVEQKGYFYIFGPIAESDTLKSELKLSEFHEKFCKILNIDVHG